MTDPSQELHPAAPHSPDSGLDPGTRERLDKIWRKAYGARTRDDLLDLYATWAGSYDEDHEAIGFTGHVTASRVLARHVPFAEVAPVLDAGAGTGAAGVALHALGYRNLTALDFSAEMLAKAEEKDLYRSLHQADLGRPLDEFPDSHFAAAILVGVFSYGQAPAHALDELVRVVEPGGVIVFTLRTDFHAEGAMGVRGKMESLEKEDIWRLLDVTDPEPYLPKKDPKAMFRVWCYRVLPTKDPDPTPEFIEEVKSAFLGRDRVKRLDHCFIWNSMASRLYNDYTACRDYYLTDCEEEILKTSASEIAGGEKLIVELGCGSARKIRHVLEAALRKNPGREPTYVPIDISRGALEATRKEIHKAFGDRLAVAPERGHFDEVLPRLDARDSKVVFFFGSSLGNIESLERTFAFLRRIRDLLSPGERLVVGLDLDKDDEVLVGAYEAGEANRSFFLNMVRRINSHFGGNLDLDAFDQESTVDPEPPCKGIHPRCVNMKLVTKLPQEVYLIKLDLEAHLDAGDAIQIGTSRKFKAEQIGALAAAAGLKLQRQWFDSRRYFSLNELVREEPVN